MPFKVTHSVNVHIFTNYDNLTDSKTSNWHRHDYYHHYYSLSGFRYKLKLNKGAQTEGLGKEEM